MSGEVVGGAGIEPATSSSSTTRSPTELTAHHQRHENYSATPRAAFTAAGSTTGRAIGRHQ